VRDLDLGPIREGRASDQPSGCQRPRHLNPTNRLAPLTAAAIYDERFCRMWEFYLAAVELEFLHGTHMVNQPTERCPPTFLPAVHESAIGTTERSLRILNRCRLSVVVPTRFAKRRETGKE